MDVLWIIDPEPVSPPAGVVTLTVTTLGETVEITHLSEPAGDPSATEVRVDAQVPSLEM